MSADSASLLTKTQRRRISNDFEDLNDDARSRDERRIRERFAAGLGDLSRLVDYPDDQLALAVEDVDDDTLVTTLADGRVLLDRIAEVRTLDRERVVSRADARATAAAESPTDTASLARLDFETETERRERFAREHDDTSVWDRRANRLLQLAAWLFLPAVILWIPDTLLGVETLSQFTLVWALPAIAGVVPAFVGLSIKLLKSLKYSVLPVARRLI
ncbi:MAG: hypothetical protein U5K28_12005, partial [Halobacteriales archaeon]|nr:hypothetical protein [Halobacteriales archaeon]